MKIIGLGFIICFAVKNLEHNLFPKSDSVLLSETAFFFFFLIEPNPRTRPYSHRAWTPHEPHHSFGRGLVQKGGVVRVCVYVCVRACVCASGPHVMSCLQTVQPLFSPPSPHLFVLLAFSSVSVQSGNVDLRGLDHRVSPSSPVPCFWLRSVSAKWSGSKVSARRRIKTLLPRSPRKDYKVNREFIEYL